MQWRKLQFVTTTSSEVGVSTLSLISILLNLILTKIGTELKELKQGRLIVGFGFR